MLNPLINRDIEQQDKNKPNDTYWDFTWCIFCDFGSLFTCCLE